MKSKVYKLKIRENHMLYAIDESEFITIKDIPVWVVAIINTVNKKDIICNITRTRNTPFMNSFINKYIKKEIHYLRRMEFLRFFKYPKLWIQTFIFNHARGQWGRGRFSTSYLDSFWVYVKSILKSIYNSISNKGFFLLKRN